MASSTPTRQSAFALLMRAMDAEERQQDANTRQDVLDTLRLYEIALRALRSLDSSSSEVVRAVEMARERAKFLRARLQERDESREVAKVTNATWEQSLRKYERRDRARSPGRASSSSSTSNATPKSSLTGLPKTSTYASNNSSPLTTPSGARDSSPSKTPEPLTEMEKNLEGTIVPEATYAHLDFESVVGQVKAKRALMEGVVLPQLRPDLFDGLLSLNQTSAVLLFGPPGNGKSMMVKALASAMRKKQGKHVFISVTAASLTSKWIGEGEKMVRNLFTLALKKAPSIVFIDEIDSILTSRSQSEHESSRRLKTEFFTAFDSLGAQNHKKKKARVLVVAATNRPQELDTAAIRRFTKRIHVEMPDVEARRKLVETLLAKEERERVFLNSAELEKIAKATEGYSNSDLTNLVREAAMGPIREINPSSSEFLTLQKSDLRPIELEDFANAIAKVRPSVTKDEIESFNKWNALHGDVS